jgi:hypothetical protein
MRLPNFTDKLTKPFRLAPSHERPALLLGLIGFSEEERQAIAAQLLPGGELQWEISDVADADAWLVHGARTRVVATGEVVVDAAQSGDAPVRLSLPKLDRPIAFSKPLAEQEFRPAWTFDQSPMSLLRMLAKFSRWLHTRLALLHVANVMIQNAPKVRRSRVYHVMGTDHRLLAVVDLHNQTGVSPEATMADIESALWLPRPESAAIIPEEFATRDTPELIWEFSTRTGRNLLPARFRRAPIGLQSSPLPP